MKQATLKRSRLNKIRSRNARAGLPAKTGNAVIVLHAYSVTLVLSYAASRRLRFKD